MKKLLLLPAFSLVLASCQEVISVDLNKTASKLVVEGEVRTNSGPYPVKLSTSTSYFTPNTFVPVQGAEVRISDNTGRSEQLSEASPGIYNTSILQGTSGRIYTLFISSGGQKYTASATMMDTVHIDSLSNKLMPPVIGTSDIPYYSITCSFRDPVQSGNYYGFRTYRNHSMLRDISDNPLVSDKLTNGSELQQALRDGAFQPGDSIRIELISFDKSAYDFYNTLRQSLNAGNPLSSPPSNPVSNLSNGALGYFGLYAVTSKCIVIH